MNIYVAGPMRGYKNFNFPEFDRVTALVRSQGHAVFNPAEKDREIHGDDIGDSATGDLEEASNKGFNLREALLLDLEYICKYADAVCTLDGWENSKGAQAETATARALGIQVFSWQTLVFAR